MFKLGSKKTDSTVLKQKTLGSRKTAARDNGDLAPMLVMLSPFLLFFFLFTVLPILSSIVLSFTSYDMLSAPKLVGLDNYHRMLVNDSVFSITVKNTLVFAIIAGPLGFLISFLLAWLVNEFSPKIRTVLSFLFYAPSLVGNAYFIWKVAFSGITEPIIWLKNPTYIMPIIIIVQLWQSMGVSFLANISGLQNLSRDIY